MLRFKWMIRPGRRPGFGEDRSGATAIEYALIAAFIAVSIVLVAPAIGVTVNGLYEIVAAAL